MGGHSATQPVASSGNRAIVQAFYQTALNDRDADGSARWIGATYRQHNPLIADGYDGLRQYLELACPQLLAL